VLLFGFGLAWMLGIAAGDLIPLGVWQLVLLFGGAALSAMLFFSRRLYRITFMMLSIFVLGNLRYQPAYPDFPAEHVANFNHDSREAVLTGVVVDDPDVRDSYTGLRVRAEWLRIEGRDPIHLVQGEVLVQAPRSGDWAFGDRIRAIGLLTSPALSYDFSYRDYLARRNIYSQMQKPLVSRVSRGNGSPVLHGLYALRGILHQSIYRIYPDPEASLLAGILLGIESGIAPEVREAFNRTGTTHIIAISGFKIPLI
jgi:competence protein ComEC